MRKAVFIFVVFYFWGCENILIKDDVSNDHLSVFELYWNDFDENYPGFIQRNINWDSIKQVNIEEIESGISDEEFWTVMKNTSLCFKDIHLQLIRSQNIIRYNSNNPNSANSVTSISDYLENSKNINNIFFTASIKNENIAYISIPSFSSSLDVSNFEIIDAILAEFSFANGLIIDIRSNSGGANSNQRTVASRFLKEQFVVQHQLRDGPNHDDFADPILDNITPNGVFQFTKPVVVLTNANTASGAEIFAMILKSQDHVSIVGDITAKGFGNSVWRELPNGWNYRMTTTLVSDENGISYEGIGITPDELVWISKTDSINNIDTQLEKAIEFLQ